MTGLYDIRIPAGGCLLALAVLLPACAAPVRPFGALATPGQDRSFAMATGGTAEADAAVRDALVAAGYQAAADARYRIEVGLAVRAPRTQVMAAAGDAKALQPLAPVSSPPGLCRRRSYVLSIAFVERASGRVAARGGAVTSRCGKAGDAALLPLLAKAALANATAS
jgi:hypothetical protein